MPAKNKHPFTEDGVLAYITENRGIQYQCSGISKVFKVSARDMLPVLQKLTDEEKIISNSSGRYRYFIIPTEEQIARSQQTIYVRPWRPLKGYEASMRAIADMAEKGR